MGPDAARHAADGDGPSRSDRVSRGRPRDHRDRIQPARGRAARRPRPAPAAARRRPTQRLAPVPAGRDAVRPRRRSNDRATLLDVADLTVAFGDKVVVDHVTFTIERGGRLAIIGESGSGKTLTALSVIGLAPDNATITGRVDVRRSATARALRRRAVEAAPGADRDGVPEPADVAQPADAGGQADRRAAAPPPRHGPGHGATRRDRAVRPRRAARTRTHRARLSAPAVRRSATAHRHRHRARLPAGAADRRRADDGARRHRAGRGAGAARRADRRRGHHAAVHHPRHRPGAVGGRRPDGDAPRPHRRGGTGCDDRRAARRPVHRRAARRGRAHRAARRRRRPGRRCHP